MNANKENALQNKFANMRIGIKVTKIQLRLVEKEFTKQLINTNNARFSLTKCEN